MATRAIRLIACYFELPWWFGLGRQSLSLSLSLSSLFLSHRLVLMFPSDRGATNLSPRSASPRRTGFMCFGS